MSHAAGDVADDLPWIVSVDDHVIEPPDLWVSRAPTGRREDVPHTEQGDDGLVYWVYEHFRTPIAKTVADPGARGGPLGQFVGSYDELQPAYYDASARLEAMNADRVLASMCFPTIPRFCGQTFHEASDRELALHCLRSFNDWTVEEWAGAAPGRFIPLVIIPLWDPVAAAREIERTASAGAKAIAFSENPAKLGLPSLHDRDGYWDPVLRAANDTGMPLCIHFGSSSSTPTTSDDAPLLVRGTLAPLNLAFALADWLFCGKLIDGDRSPYPDLKVCLSEGGIGWLPYLLERCDHMVATHPWTADADFRTDIAAGLGGRLDPSGARAFGVPPSEVFRRHIFGCFIDDEFGARNLDAVGFGNVMLETDYPHADSTFPHSAASAQRLLAHCTADQRHQVMRGNAERVFSFQPAAVPDMNWSPQ